MLVSLELKAIADKHGTLSPELVLGYRAVRVAREEFDSPNDLRAMIFNTTAAQLAINELLGVGNVSVRDYGRHAYTFCQVSTGSVLHLDVPTEVLCLPSCCRSVEDQLLEGTAAEEDALCAYRAVVSEMVARILTDPPDQIFGARRYWCLPAGGYPAALCRFVRCERCGSPTRTTRLYDVEGFLLCPACAGVEPTWFARHTARARS